MTVENPLAQAELEILEEHQQKEKINNEEFKIWKKTVPLLYDTIHTHALDFPSLSLQWLPDYGVADNKNSIDVKLLIGTNTSQSSQDYLKLVSFNVPSTLAPNFSSILPPNSQGVPVPLSNVDTPANYSFKVLSTWKHKGEINRIKLSPNGEKAITFDNEGVVHLYDLKNTGATISAPTSFKYHKLEGYALEWIDDSSFLSGANDSQIALWDVSKPSTPIQVFRTHGAVVNDISYNRNGNGIFASVSDDYTTQIHDLKSKPVTTTSTTNQANPAIKITTSHIQNAVAFHPEIPTLFITGGKDNIISLYDLRNPLQPIRKFFGHNDSVIGVKWDALTDPSVFLSWGLDKRVISWDISSIDEDFTYPTISENGGGHEVATVTNAGKKKQTKVTDPCLRFIHGGHTNRVNDVDLHPSIKGLVASCGDDNLIEVWRAKTIFEEVEIEEEDEEKAGSDVEMKE
ncbi:histone acetyltransferase type B subunit 2 [[Candida] anglica]|uniref:Histone acetyltransferase type B subunit 2 n=1 Tax=[Candida] anglica TaxID=148631 RepID=A0ABP0ELE6_9ASCO